MKYLLPNQLAAVLLATLCVTAIAEMDTGDHGLKLIEWLREKGGFVNEKLEIRRADPSDPTSRFGMFANGDISLREKLLVIPNKCLIHPIEEDDNDEDDDDVHSPMQCATVRSLIKEMRLADDSFYAPYVNYLLAEPWGQLPSAWSDPGKQLFTRILEDYTALPLPPVEPNDWLDEWYGLCDGAHDPFEENAALMIIQRSWDDVLIPVFDMMSHRNPPYLNTMSNTVHGDDDVTVKAKIPIKAGGEIYTSYNMCEDCENRVEVYGTPDILRDYGFVEQYPQRWIFLGKIGIQIDEKIEGSGDLSVSWTSNLPDENSLKFMKDVRAGMKLAGEKELTNPSDKVPAAELATIRTFHKDLSTALDLAIDAAYSEDEACTEDEQTCVVRDTRYVDLMDDVEEPHLGKTCDTDIFMEFETYKDIETHSSLYQTMSFNHDKNTKDVCFDLDNTVQICTSYRPHYHEPSVHWGARYFKNIKRALFVGGGDSMLLHEILKYPTLEKVVGLELDQSVTRRCFKYFGTSPHWDDDRVEWWFGDATKSLLMLPNDYFGSFDMVLVDLSETVMSLTVTGELDIMEALSLLLSPDGFMLKNELYFEGMSDIFEHTVMLHYSDVPIICSQAMVLGSNSINFLSDDNLTDHGVENYLLGDTLENDKHFDIVHSYTRNLDNIKKHCKKEDDELEKVSLRQTKSPGIVMIIDAEEASIEGLDDLEDIVALVNDVVTDVGFSVVSSVSSEEDEEAVVTVMKEGYVTTRYWADYDYFAFTTHLWSSFEKQEELEAALVSAVGSEKSKSSFRIVAGGMFGVDSWKDDESKRGPRRTNPCTAKEPKQTETELSNDLVKDLIKEGLSYASDAGEATAVICGLKSSGSCPAVEAAKDSEFSGEVITIWSCPGVTEYGKDSSSEIYGCEVEVKKELRAALGGKKLRAVVFDEDAQYSMGLVLNRVFNNLKTMLEMLTKSTTVVATSSERVSWQSNFMHEFRTEVLEMEPAFQATLQVNGSDKTRFLHMATSDEGFTTSLQQSIKDIEEQGLVVELEDLRGGQTDDTENAEFVPSRMYKPEDYPQEDGLKQFASQQQMEYQTIAQFEKSKGKISRSKVKAALEAGFDGEPVSVEEIPGLGDGGLFVAIDESSRIVVLWDGKNHIDVDLTVDEEEEEFSNTFIEHFLEQIPDLKLTLRDEMPRGYGRVVNFNDDLKGIDSPFWA